MFATSLDLGQFSGIAAEMTITDTDSHGLVLVHQGMHPVYGQCTLAQADEYGLLVLARAYGWGLLLVKLLKVAARGS